VSGTISNGYLAGNFISFSGSTDDGVGTVFYDNVTLDSITAPKNMTGTYEFSSEVCDQSQSLTLTKQ